MSSSARGTHNSPGIYTQETQVATATNKSVAATTLGLVGETLIGPAFQPIPISTYKEFQTYFGGCAPDKYKNGYPKYELGYIAKSYLAQSSSLYVTRVLGLSGYNFEGLWALGIHNTNDNTNSVFATIRSKADYETTGDTLNSYVTGITVSGLTGITGIDDTFVITANKAVGVSEVYTVSLNSANKNYILKVLGKTYNASSKTSIYVEEMYEAVISKAVNPSISNEFYSGSTVSATTRIDSFNDYTDYFSYAQTPWFVSEVKGNKIIPLFRFITVTDGNAANEKFKISIKNIDVNTLKFDIQIRSISDTDSNLNVYESYTNCTLDPNDGTSYLGAKIGTIDQVYEQKSKYVMVEINDDDEVSESVPLGFSGYKVKVIPQFPNAPSINYNKTISDLGTSASKKPYCGISSAINVDTDFFNYKGVSGLELTKGFHMETAASGLTFTDPNNSSYSCGFDSLDSDSYTLALGDSKKLMKFTAYFYGGFDGWDIWRTNRTNTDDYQYNNYIKKASHVGSTNMFSEFEGATLNSNYGGIPNIPAAYGMTSDYYAWWSAIRSYEDPELVDINVFATSGIDWENNPTLVSEAIDMIETDRKDSIYIITTPDKNTGASDTKSEMISADQIVEDLGYSDIDTNYAATYYPWCQYYDNENGTYLYLPVTRDVVKNLAYTDNNTYSWFAPAGISRGGVDCIKAKKSLILDEEDTLYTGRVNIVKTFAQDGVKIWGQKTLQSEDAPLNRIGVRRMMLYLRKTVRRSNLTLIFEPNDDTTKTKFLEIVNPILTAVKTNRGISNFKIDIDDSTEAKLRHEMNVQIWVKPIGALEYINIDFMITDEGFDFSTLS
jgi:hypothetical protein